MRFITVSLLFMGWVFWEMSGGADFVPPSQRDAGAMASATITQDTPAMAANAAEANAAEADGAEPIATRAAGSPALDGLTFATMSRPAAPETDGAASGEARIIPASATADTAAPRNIGEGSLKVIALDTPTSEPVPATDPAATPEKVALFDAPDIREVTGSSVNMRNGPGTRFGVLDRLGRGDRVEVLQDPGQGWVKLRVERTGRIGWMADFLLTETD